MAAVLIAAFAGASAAAAPDPALADTATVAGQAEKVIAEEVVTFVRSENASGDGDTALQPPKITCTIKSLTPVQQGVDPNVQLVVGTSKTTCTAPMASLEVSVVLYGELGPNPLDPIEASTSGPRPGVSELTWQASYICIPDDEDLYVYYTEGLHYMAAPPGYTPPPQFGRTTSFNALLPCR